MKESSYPGNFKPETPLAIASVPYQHWGSTYEPCKALAIGTIFPPLNKPFCGKGGKR